MIPMPPQAVISLLAKWKSNFIIVPLLKLRPFFLTERYPDIHSNQSVVDGFSFEANGSLPFDNPAGSRLAIEIQ